MLWLATEKRDLDSALRSVDPLYGCQPYNGCRAQGLSLLWEVSMLSELAKGAIRAMSRAPASDSDPRKLLECGMAYNDDSYRGCPGCEPLTGQHLQTARTISSDIKDNYEEALEYAAACLGLM